MKELFRQLMEIDSILEQIATITMNQMTVLLHSTWENQDASLNILEEMVSYKDELITNLIEVEALFDKRYAEQRDQVHTSKQIGEFKKCVSNILEKKEKIQELERNNMMMLQTKRQERGKRIEVPKRAQEVVRAYKKQQIK